MIPRPTLRITFLNDISQEQFAFPALTLSCGNSGLCAKESTAQEIVGVKLSPQLFLPPPANNRAGSNIWTPLICLSLLSAE